MFELYLPILKTFIYSALFVLLLLGVKVFFANLKYKRSQYRAVSGNSLIKTLFDKGNYGEFLTFALLEKLQGENKLLTNIYLPNDDGTTTEIDLLMINKTGIYVFESKNYSGWIFGDEKSKMWTQSLKGGKKYKFFNPIWQNKGHINTLANLVEDVEIKDIFSYIIFGERCELKKVSVTSVNVFVINRNHLLSKIKNNIATRTELLSSSQMNDLFALLKKYTLVDARTKQQHIESVKSKIEKSK